MSNLEQLRRELNELKLQVAQKEKEIRLAMENLSIKEKIEDLNNQSNKT